MRSDILVAQALGEAFFVKPSVMNSLTDFLASGMQVEQNIDKVPNPANNSVTLQKISNEKTGKALAILAVDGAMYKKDMSGFCMSVASYQKIEAKSQEAKAMYNAGEISLLIYRVTTPGGGVFGLDAVETMIGRLNMPTITFCEDQMCSAGVYAFMATDKVYAAPMTEIGSIGTVVEIKEDKKKKYKTVTSRRAKNKRPDYSTEEGMSKLVAYLNVYEDKFYQVVQKNTGFTEEQIEKEFDNGGTIMSEKAAEIGFIDEVIVFEDLIERELENMGGSNTANAEASASVPTASSDKLAQNSNTGANMEFNQENFNILLESREHLNGNIGALNTQNAEQATALEAAQSELATANSALTEATARQEDTETRMREAISQGVNADTAVLMLQADSAEDASKLAIAANSSDGASGKPDANVEPKQNAWAEFEKKD